MIVVHLVYNNRSPFARGLYSLYMYRVFMLT
jgi:hypothetical protein